MASTVLIGTHYVVPDEKVWAFAETWVRSPVKGDRRVQKFVVLRGDSPAIYEEDVGSFDIGRDHIFSAPLCFWEYTVAEMRELAMLSRAGTPPRDMEDRLDLKAAFVRHLEERRARREHRSSFGPYLRKER